MNTPKLFTPCGDVWEIDVRDGNYYVSALDAGRTSPVAGPFSHHVGALSIIRKCRRIVEEHDPRAHFYSFGTVAMSPEYTKPGVLNREGLI